MQQGYIYFFSIALKVTLSLSALSVYTIHVTVVLSCNSMDIMVITNVTCHLLCNLADSIMYSVMSG